MLKSPWFQKVGALALVVLCLWLSLQMVGGLVYERMARQREAEQSVAASFAGEQTLTGPVAQRWCTETWTAPEGEGKERTMREHTRQFALHAWPQLVDAEEIGRASCRERVS
jgi:inner membrane protein